MTRKAALPRTAASPAGAWPRRFGLLAFVVGFLADRAHKGYMLDVYDIGDKGRVALLPTLDLVMVWNTGVSYGLFDSYGVLGRYALAGVGLAGGALFALMLWRTSNSLSAIAFGLIASGALSNAVDRFVYGAVADFFLFHIGDFEWYVFNVADVAIVAGVIGLMLSWLFERPEIAKNR